MFSHPALLRELNQLSDFLRRSGESEWSRRIAQASDEMRRLGWTEAGAERIRALRKGELGLDKLVFGLEHARFLGEHGLERASEQLARHRGVLEQLLDLPTRAAPMDAARPRSIDLP